MAATQSELRLGALIDERQLVRGKHEQRLGEIQAREDKTLTESDSQQLTGYRERAAQLDDEIKDLAEEIKRHNDSVEESKAIRRVLSGTGDGTVDVDGELVVYREFKQYAHDMIITSGGQECSRIARQWGRSDDDIQAARERIQLAKRTPANTLSSNVAGLTPPQHLAQIFQVIDTSRPLVASALRDTLERGQLTYPQVDTKPVVAVQTTQKTEAGNTGMAISMVTATASTYLGGGDLSWQAINWSTPNALDLWFRFAAADYALKTEQDAAQAMQHSAFTNVISSPLASTPTFAQFMTAVGAGYAKVFSVSARTANTIYMAPDRFGYLLGLTSDAFTQFTNVTGSQVGPLNVVVSRGMDTGVIAVGDSDGLLVAETGGAPVEMRVVEPAIGGVEVGLIGAFEAVVVDNGSFTMLTTAS